VEFKRSKGFCEKTAFCAEDFEIGDYIRVESDSRTHELGVVCNICVMSSETTPFFGENGRENFRKIIGRATPSEKALFLTKIRDEERALHICNELVARKRLPIVVVEAKFQLDRTKLTFLYMSDRSFSFPLSPINLFSLLHS
jgi:cell fate regulator YaaT (PSP1 superfamily)